MGRRGARRVLVLTSDTGSGHRSVSRALVDAARERDGIELVEVDPLAPLPALFRPGTEPEPPAAFDRLVKLYGPVIVRAPWLWGWAFRLLDNEAGLRTYLALAAGRAGDRIVEAINAVQVDAVVSVHPLVNHLLVRARERLARPNLPLLTVLTDLVNVHYWWAASGIDRYVAGSDAAARRLFDLGIPPQRLATVGIPIRREFARMYRTTREVRQQLQLDTETPMLLLMGGGEGAGRLPQTARALAGLARRGVDFQIVVITGRNARARIEIEALDWPIPARVLGFVTNVVEYMAAADLIATKPGSLTVAEALALARPLLLGRPLPGQEEGNVPYIVDSGAGLAYRSPEECAEAAAVLLSDAALRWEMGQQAARLSHPHATERTLDLLQGMLLEAERQVARTT